MTTCHNEIKIRNRKTKTWMTMTKFMMTIN